MTFIRKPKVHGIKHFDGAQSKHFYEESFVLLYEKLSSHARADMARSNAKAERSRCPFVKRISIEPAKY